MQIYTSFPDGWWILTFFFYGLYLLLGLSRKSFSKKDEVWPQFQFGLAALLLSIVVENIGIRTGLWTYFPENWPIILWVNYFGSGLVGYQVLKKIEDGR